MVVVVEGEEERNSTPCRSSGPRTAVAPLAQHHLYSGRTRRVPHLSPELGPELVAALADLQRDYLSRHLESLAFFDGREK